MFATQNGYERHWWLFGDCMDIIAAATSFISVSKNQVTSLDIVLWMHIAELSFMTPSRV